MNTHDSHLSERAIEALACGRDDLASEAEREHASRCETCGAARAAARELATGTRALLLQTAAEPSPAQLDAWVERALAATATVSGEIRALEPARRPSRPGRLQLGAAAALALAIVGAGVLSRELPTLGGGIRIAREIGVAGLAVAQVFLGLVPGGRASVVIAGAALMLVLAVLIRRIASEPSGDFARAARRMFSAGLLTLAAFVLGFAQPAAALEFQGDWDQIDRPVTLTVERAAASDVLRQAASAAGVSLIASLPEDPPVTLAVTDVPLREVVAAVLEGVPVVAKLNGKVLVIRGAPALARAPAQPAPVQALPAPPVLPAPPRWGDDDDDDDRRERKRSKARDRVTMGENAVIAEGERVKDLVTMGGDADIAGEVTGDVVTMGGAVRVRRTAAVRGDVVTFGGDVTIEPGAIVEGSRVGFGSAIDGKKWKRAISGERSWSWWPLWFGKLLASVAHYALLFLLGMLLLSFVPDRMSALERTLVRAPGRSLALGSVGFLAAIVAMVVLAITIIGIPAALVLLIALPVALYLGLAAIAATLGAAIPLERIQRSPIAQLACGVGILFLFSLIPFLGTIGLIVAATVGLGAVLLTRFSKHAFGEPA